MQFNDVRAMLQLPRREAGIEPACNFGIVSLLCGLVSGISTTIYRPPSKFGLPDKIKYRSGDAFKELVAGYFPCPPSCASYAEDLYKLARNPMAHSSGVMDAETPVVFYKRLFHASHPEEGWTNKELDDLERTDSGFTMPHPGIVVVGDRWTLHCDSFYFEVIEMLRGLTADKHQMAEAEARFGRCVCNWRKIN